MEARKEHHILPDHHNHSSISNILPPPSSGKIGPRSLRRAAESLIADP
jgi:hypothetical protein